MKLILKLIILLINSALLCNAVCSRGVFESGVSQNERNFIVNEHNRLRMMLAKGQVGGQPRAINLKRMYWDDRLAQAAQNIANTCVYGHVRVSDPRWQVGQNIATSWSSNDRKGANWSEPIMNWWNEYRQYKYPGGFSMATGHYTQMAWDDTKYVGCGYTYFPISNGNMKYQKIYVCNYGPAGNYPRAPYKTGNSGCENLC
ncbi:unnamed protein product [Ceutorhynchus assimilis]|uniref:SCP domain-containing protein n=1 Tax=Ceutorhynchus assimilis TaxID=467358 RepID=A0A9N9QNH9_9CUCU|nr:unnamed protein product [Ceutorhynchus assimilis]